MRYKVILVYPDLAPLYIKQVILYVDASNLNEAFKILRLTEEEIGFIISIETKG